ncbi:hypothetical protein [Cryobacterium algoritolerans]|uniref:hypothetical protein n=1 Tax=Cryobacterium algoritolerans TaxID=1259184 RepID=UPI001F53E6AE|nr:hypothetical protein [Cryobacterium algoritolerans]
MAGYSGTPLRKELGLTAGHPARLLHAPPRWIVPDAPAGIDWLTGETDAPAAVIVAFHTHPAAFVAELPCRPDASVRHGLDRLAARGRPVTGAR